MGSSWIFGAYVFLLASLSGRITACRSPEYPGVEAYSHVEALNGTIPTTYGIILFRAFDAIDQSEGSREEQYEPEIRVHDTGDYAVTWAVYYYIKDVKRLLAIKQAFRAYVLEESMRSGISLATPDLHAADLKLDQQST